MKLYLTSYSCNTILQESVSNQSKIHDSFDNNVLNNVNQDVKLCGDLIKHDRIKIFDGNNHAEIIFLKCRTQIISTMVMEFVYNTDLTLI